MAQPTQEELAEAMELARMRMKIGESPEAKDAQKETLRLFDERQAAERAEKSPSKP